MNPSMNNSMNEGLAKSLLQVNKLNYALPPSIGIASKCTHQTNFSNQNIYQPSSTIIFDVQTGSQFVDAAASYLKFVVKPETGKAGNWGAGSAANIVERVVVRLSNGTEMSRLEDASLFVKMYDVAMKNTNWRDTLGANQGYNPLDFPSRTANVYGEAVPTTGKTFIIPVQCLMPCMSPHGGALLPPNAMSGMRIELTLRSTADAFCAQNQVSFENPPTTYTVERPEIHWKVYELADQFQQAIQQMAKSTGLNLLWKEQFHTIISPGGAATSINFDIKKACSKALKARMLTRLNSVINQVGADKHASAVFNYDSQQAHIGSDYFPNQKLTLTTVDINSIAEPYYYAMYAQDKLEYWSPSGVAPKEFLGVVLTGSKTNDIYNSGHLAYNFVKSNVSDLSGYTTSNSRALLVDLQLASAQDVRIDCYLEFLRLSKLYLSNAVVLD